MIRFRVSVDGHDKQDVTAGPRDILKWEAAIPNASFTEFLNTYRLTALYQIAWYTLKRAKTLPGNLPDLPDTLTEFMAGWDVEPGHGEIETEESDPTQPVA